MDGGGEIYVSVSKDKMTVWVKMVHVAEGEATSGNSSPVTEEQVMVALAAKGIIYGIDRDAVRQVVAGGWGQDACVARGSAPRPGRDAEILYHFEPQAEQEMGEQEKRLGRLDAHPIISVDAGTVLAIRRPPVQGEQGTDVMGKAVPAPPVKEVFPKAGHGVVLEDGGNKVVATIDGRPEKKGNMFAVYALYTVQGNVDATTGHIKFKGDMVIHGNVQDGIRVETRGRVEIIGMVTESTVEAGGDVVVHRNILGSTVRAGGMWILYREAHSHLVEMGGMLETLLVAARQLKDHQGFVTNPRIAQQGDGLILKVLLENKYTEIPTAIKRVIDELAELPGEEMDGYSLETIATLIGELHAGLSGLKPLEMGSLEDLVQIVQMIEEESDRFADAVQKSAGYKAQIKASYVQNSRLEASGDVNVTGKGAYYCNIVAGGKVAVSGVPGIFRNGSISAGGDVLVRELGSPSEALTTVQVPKEAMIVADQVHPGVTLKAGARVDKIKNQTAGVRFRQ